MNERTNISIYIIYRENALVNTLFLALNIEEILYFRRMQFNLIELMLC